MSLPQLTDDSFGLIVNEHEGVALIKATAAWCQPCKVYTPILEKFMLHTHLPVYEVDIENNPKFADTFHVSSVPVVFVFSRGELKDTVVGMRSLEELKTILAAYIPS